MNNTVFIDLNPKNTKTIDVRYDDYNRRMVFDPTSFSTGDVDIAQNTITLSDHGFNTGDKVIYKSDSPMTNLQHEGMYFVIVDSPDKIKLANLEIDVENGIQFSMIFFLQQYLTMEKMLMF